MLKNPSEVLNVELFVDNQSLGQVTADPYTWSLNANRYKKRKTITMTATAENSVGNGSTLSIQVIVSQ
jgi:hypothetical protein